MLQEIRQTDYIDLEGDKEAIRRQVEGVVDPVVFQSLNRMGKKIDQVKEVLGWH